ncbi:hypothetical protein C4552_01840 [Candidatus Parcubacteria bacterium]|nr:MAG: hypothetical protein C4552_01840 [Candidatus Parcubacteria bacterium]
MMRMAIAMSGLVSMLIAFLLAAANGYARREPAMAVSVQRTVYRAASMIILCIVGATTVLTQVLLLR